MDRKFGTIRDLAQATGLSVATVSRVMNGAQNVSEKARTQVLEASSRLNYIPNPAARALTTRRSKTIAAIVPTLEHSIFARFLTAVEQSLSLSGYSLVVATSGGDPAEELRITRKLLGLGAEGFIYSGVERHPDLLNELELRNIPCVFTSCWNERAPAATIGYDNFRLARDAVSFLVDAGHEKIAVIHGPKTNNDRTKARIQGVRSFTGSRAEIAFLETELSVGGGAQAATEVLAQHQGTTAVLCFSDVLALGALFHLTGTGLSVPDDISLMGFDNLEWAETSNPPLTTIDLPTIEMGKISSRALVDKLDSRTEIEPMLLEGRIVVRESVRTLPPALGKC